MIKILQLLGCFKMPEDFIGSKADALRLLADFLDDKSKPEHTGWEFTEGETEAWKQVFQGAWPTLDKGQYKFHGSITVSDYKQEPG